MTLTALSQGLGREVGSLGKRTYCCCPVPNVVKRGIIFTFEWEEMIESGLIPTEGQKYFQQKK